MGSFYATCSVSDMTITDGDEMYIQLIVPTWVRNPYSIDGEKHGCGEKGLRVSNEGSLGEFVPFGLPILGKYADCGDIDNIVRDHNVEMLEEYFNIGIDDIVSCATDDRWYSYGMPNEKGEVSKSWAVGDNKMKNIDLLKQLTLTYFNKENYDFLSSELMSDDNYWMDEIKTKMNSMGDTLKLLSEKRKERDELSTTEENVMVVTQEHIDRYRKLFTNESNGKTDEEITNKIIVMRFRVMDNWFGDFDRKFFIPSLARNHDMFKLLPFDETDTDDVVKLYTFIINLSAMQKVLRPSYYGSQETNWVINTRFQEFCAGNFGSKGIELTNECVLDTVHYTLKEYLKKLDNKELSKEIYDDIIGELEEYGHKVKKS